MPNLNTKDSISKTGLFLEKILKSNKAILESLTNYAHGFNLELKKQILENPIFLEKMKSLFNFYKKENMDLVSLRNKVPLDAFIRLSPYIESIIVNLSDNLNLNYLVVYDIMEIYFMQNEDSLKTLYNKEEVYMTLFNNINDPNNQKLNMLKHKNYQMQATIQNEIIKEYYNERTILLEILLFLVNIINQKNHMLFEECKNVFKKIYNKENNFMKNLTNLFISYKKDFKLQKMFENQTSKETHSLTLIREQTLILENILNYSVSFNICDNPSYLILFENLIRTNFNGYLNYILSEPCSDDTRKLYTLYAQTLSDISFLFIVNTINLAAYTSESTQSKNYFVYDEAFNEIKDKSFLFFNKNNLDFIKKFIINPELKQQQKLKEEKNYINLIAFDPKTSAKEDEQDESDLFGYSHFNKIILFIFYYVIRGIESLSHQNKLMTQNLLENNKSNLQNNNSNKLFIDLISDIEKLIKEKNLNYEELEKLSIDNNFFTLTINYLISLFERDILSHERHGFHIQYKNIITLVTNLIISEKYLSDDMLLPANDNDLEKIVELIEKIYENQTILRSFWENIDQLNKNPILNLLLKFINQFPINIDLLLKMFICLLKHKDDKNSNYILQMLLEMHFYTCLCKREEIEIFDLDDQEVKENADVEASSQLKCKKVVLKEDKFNEIIKLVKGQIGKTYDEGGEFFVTFFVKYSIYDFLFLKWEKVNEFIMQMNNINATRNNPNYAYLGGGATSNIDEYQQTCCDYIRLFCDFISNAEENIDMYIASKNQEVLTQKIVYEEYSKIINSAFTTLYLIGNNKNLYHSISNLINSIYKMFYTLIKKQDSYLTFINLFMAKYICYSEADFPTMQLTPGLTMNNLQNFRLKNELNINYNVNNNFISVPEVFLNTIIFDNHYKNFDNTLLILKISKMFFKAPIIFQFLKNYFCLEFLDVLWTKVIAELAKLFYDFDSLKEEKLKILNEVISIVNELLNLISFSSNKTQIVSTENVNNLYTLIISCLNKVDFIKLIMPILKTDIQIERELNYQNVSLENYLEKYCVREKMSFFAFKKYLRKLIRNALRGLNFIFSHMISYKTLFEKAAAKSSNYTTAQSSASFQEKFILEEADEMLLIYRNLDFIKIWNDIFYSSKDFISNEIRQANNKYTINLIISLFGYLQYEFEKNYPIEIADAVLVWGFNNPEKIEKFIIDYKTFDDKFYNVGELAASAINKIIVLFKFTNYNLNLAAGNTGLSQYPNISNKALNKSINILNYLYVKKENSSEIDCSVNLFENFKEIIFNLLQTEYPSLKMLLMQTLILVSNSQPGLISLIMDDSKSSLVKNKFWEIFFSLGEGEKQLISELDSSAKQSEKDNILIKNKKEFHMKEYKKIICYLTIFLANIFSNEVFYKKSIKDLMAKYSQKLEAFLNEAVLNFKDIKKDYFTIPNEDTDIQATEEIFNGNLQEITILKSLSIIFSKIILISDSKFFNIKIERFSQMLNIFLEKNMHNFLHNFNLNIDYKFVRDLNKILQDSSSKEIPEENINFPSATKLSSYQDFQQQNYNAGQANVYVGSLSNIINIKNYIKSINISDDEYFMGVLDSLDNFNFSFNYWIDLKELFILMKTKNYNMAVFFQFLEKLYQYNFSLCVADAMVNALTSINHLLAIISSIGFNETLSTTYLFNDTTTLRLVNSSEKKLAEEIMAKDRDTFKKVNFDLIKNVYVGKKENFLKYIIENLLNALIPSEAGRKNMDIVGGDSGIFNPLTKQSEINPVYSKNFYGQYYSYKYDILFHVVEYLKNVYSLNAENIDENKINLNFTTSRNLNINMPSSVGQDKSSAASGGVNMHNYYSKIHNILIFKALSMLIDELNLYIRSAGSTEETEKCIFSIVNLLHSIFTFLTITKFEVTSEAELNSLNKVINCLFAVYNSLHNYSNTIILIVCSYMNLTNSQLNFFQNENLISNYIPLLESNKQNGNEYTMIRTITRKLKADISNANLLIILQFLNIFVKAYGLLAVEIILSEKIFLIFSLNDPFENSFTLSEYEDNERGTKHILWCWTWNFLKNILLAISETESNKYDVCYSLIIDYIILHEKRTISVLGNSDYSDSYGNTLQKSLGFVEELECMTNVLNLLYLQCRKWRNAYQEFYIRNLLILIEKTLKLYIPNIKISNHFKCFSNYENKMNEVFDSQSENLNFYKENEALSIFSPLKLTKNINLGQRRDISSVSKLEKSKQSLNYFGFNPTIFYYRIDCCLITILYNISNIIKEALLTENQSNQFCFISYILQNSSPSKIRVIEDQCQNLIYSYYYAIHTFDINIKNFEILKNLWNKSQVFFKNIISSANLGAYNLTYTDCEFKDFYFVNMFAIQNILNINLNFNSILLDSRYTYEYSFLIQLKDITCKKLDIIRNMQKSIESDSKIPEFRQISKINEALFKHIKNSFDAK